MRPYPDDLLRSMRESLTTVIIPNLADDWARYVAKAMEKIVLHLELRWQHELEFLAADSADINQLLKELQSALGAQAFSARSELAEPMAAIAAQLERAGDLLPAPDAGAINAENETYRAALVEIIDGLERAADDLVLREQLEPLRERIRTYLRRGLDRDISLAEPTNMLFGAPSPQTAQEGRA
jgi:hypothetical protein